MQPYSALGREIFHTGIFIDEFFNEYITEEYDVLAAGGKY